MIREELNRTRIAITGSTGFLGTALVSMRMVDEEILSHYIIRQRQDLQRGKRGKHVKLGEILIQRRLISEEQLQETIESYPEHKPQMALFLAFLQIFRIAQDHLNLLTAKHLSFYYEKVLQLGHNPVSQ